MNKKEIMELLKEVSHISEPFYNTRREEIIITLKNENVADVISELKNTLLIPWNIPDRAEIENLLNSIGFDYFMCELKRA